MNKIKSFIIILLAFIFSFCQSNKNKEIIRPKTKSCEVFNDNSKKLSVKQHNFSLNGDTKLSFDDYWGYQSIDSFYNINQVGIRDTINNNILADSTLSILHFNIESNPIYPSNIFKYLNIKIKRIKLSLNIARVANEFSDLSLLEANEKKFLYFEGWKNESNGDTVTKQVSIFYSFYLVDSSRLLSISLEKSKFKLPSEKLKKRFNCILSSLVIE